MGSDASALLYASFPGPEPGCFTETAVADEVCAAVSFPIQLAGAFFQQEIKGKVGRGDFSRIVVKSPGAQCVDITECYAWASSRSSPQYGFGIHQVDIRQPEHREIRVYKTEIRTGLSVGLHVCELRDNHALFEIRNGIDFGARLSFRIETGSFVARFEIGGKLVAHPVACPAPANAVVLRFQTVAAESCKIRNVVPPYVCVWVPSNAIGKITSCAL